MDLIEKAEHEMTELSRQIAAMQQRQDALKSFIAIARTLVESDEPAWQEKPGAALAEAVTAAVRAPSPPKPGARLPTTKDQVLALAEEAISNAGRPLQTRDLLDYVEARGVSIRATDKVLAVSTILSRAKNKFISKRSAGGWFIAAADDDDYPKE